MLYRGVNYNNRNGVRCEVVVALYQRLLYYKLELQRDIRSPGINCLPLQDNKQIFGSRGIISG